jgi:hypothetical protein
MADEMVARFGARAKICWGKSKWYLAGRAAFQGLPGKKKRNQEAGCKMAQKKCDCWRQQTDSS